MRPKASIRPMGIWKSVSAIGVVAGCALLAVSILSTRATGAAQAAPKLLSELATLAVSADDAEAKDAIARLRAAGPAGLEALFAANAELVKHHAYDETGTASDRKDPGWRRLSAAIDAVAAQKDAYASGLYWHTDLDSAKQAARESGKPILSLRLLGRLDTEFSCANSRFFRTALYANREVSTALRERFVLHWKSVRPVPKITIDFGDGRVVERTITGNSIHYVLDAEGNVIDAVPGLYGPSPFLQMLDEAAAVEKGTRKMQAATRARFLASWHTGKAAQILEGWQADLRWVGALPAEAAAAKTPANAAELMAALTTASQADEEVTVLQPNGLPAGRGPVLARDLQQPAAGPPLALDAALLTAAKADTETRLVRAVAPNGKPAAPAAAEAAPIARGKYRVERPLVAAVAPAARPAAPKPPAPAPAARRKPAPLDAKALEALSDDATWAKIAALHAEEARLDGGSRALMASKLPDALVAAATAETKRKVEAPLVRIARNFERSVAEDTVRNEYGFHRQIHAWLASGAGASVEPLNERVYAELFLTPSTDPWLGLLPPDTYTALENDGLCK